MTPGSVVWIADFDEVPRHLFRVDVVHEDCVEGVALTGPLAGCHGEPALELILGPAGPGELPLGTSESQRVSESHSIFPLRSI